MKMTRCLALSRLRNWEDKQDAKRSTHCWGGSIAHGYAGESYSQVNSPESSRCECKNSDCKQSYYSQQNLRGIHIGALQRQENPIFLYAFRRLALAQKELGLVVQYTQAIIYQLNVDLPSAVDER